MPRVKYHAGKCLVTGRYASVIKMQGSRKGKGLSEGGQRNGETEMPGSSGGLGEGRSLEAQTDLEGKTGLLLPCFC